MGDRVEKALGFMLHVVCLEIGEEKLMKKGGDDNHRWVVFLVLLFLCRPRGQLLV